MVKLARPSARAATRSSVSAGAVYDFLIAGEHARPADIDVSARRASTLETSGAATAGEVMPYPHVKWTAVRAIRWLQRKYTLVAAGSLTPRAPGHGRLGHLEAHGADLARYLRCTSSPPAARRHFFAQSRCSSMGPSEDGREQ